MKLDISQENTATVVVVDESRLDAATASDFRKSLVQVARNTERNVVLDLAKVTFVDSAGLGSLVAGLKALAPEQTMVLCRVCPRVVSLLKLTMLHKALVVYPDLDSALSSLNNPDPFI